MMAKKEGNTTVRKKSGGIVLKRDRRLCFEKTGGVPRVSLFGVFTMFLIVADYDWIDRSI
jgi:hypothetical protein